MRNIITKGTVFVLTISLVLSCNAIQNANNTQKGAVIGASGGAVIGGVIGNNVGKGNTNAPNDAIGQAERHANGQKRRASQHAAAVDRMSFMKDESGEDNEHQENASYQW